MLMAFLAFVFFPHFRPRDVLKAIFLLFFHKLCVHCTCLRRICTCTRRICTCIRRHLKETIPSSGIMWSEMGKQNVQKVHLSKNNIGRVGKDVKEVQNLCIFILSQRFQSQIVDRNALGNLHLFRWYRSHCV